MKIWKFALMLFCLGTASAALAQQPKPTVAIVLNQLNAQMGDTVGMYVEIRGGVNIAGADVGIKVDPTCLKIIDRQVGDYLPTEADKKGFSAFSELNEHDTRLAASLLKGGPIANGNGVFYRVKLQVICEQANAALDVSFVELTSIEDPAAQNRKFVALRLDKGEIDTVSAQLAIGPVASVTSAAPNTPEGQTATVAPTATQSVEVAGTTQSPIVPIVLIVLTIAGVILLVVVVQYMRNRPKDSDPE